MSTRQRATDRLGVQRRAWRVGSRATLAAGVCLVLVRSGVESLGAADLAREEHRVAGDPGVDLFVRRVHATSTKGAGPAIVLLHGARVPSVASFDLAVPGGSLAADLARAGHDVYLMDARGYGGSTRPPEMSQPLEAHAPLVRSADVVRDVAAVVEWICRRRGVERVALLGWATGGHWLGYYATLHPKRAGHLILLNSLYGAFARHASLGAGSDLEDPRRPGRFHAAAFGAYRVNTAASLFTAWDRSIPAEFKDDWRDPAVAAAYAEAALASDPTSGERRPPAFRAPTGALEDSYYLATGRQLWDASLITCPTLIIRSERDFWSRPEDVIGLAERLVHAPAVRQVLLPEATHFVHLDRPERGRDRLVREILDFLARTE